ncbi:WASH complex subunit 2 [Lutzomyia longipalpis]|uniref:WASH complex subunit 2 n=1 Tax=Lutzomyia longipalpis TaxID=7200 RepID=UPI002483B36B|nr:WASH complex subunit 2 [Lutzomyia longipalpis]
MNMFSERAQVIREQAKKWSLQGDSQLLEYMKEISKNLESLARHTDLRINRMCLSGQEVNVALGNVTNCLLALQHTQFVENRVHDEDEDENVAAPDKARKDEADTKQMSPMTTLNTLLGNSVKCLNNCYERVDVELDEDSADEDDEPTRSVVFRPRDPYRHRPLPYVIGSKEFKEKWHVGLVDSESDTENEDAQFSEGASESEMSVSLPNSAGDSEGESDYACQGTSNAAAYKSDDEQPTNVPQERAYFQPPKITPHGPPPQIEDTPPNLFSDSPPPEIPGLSKVTGLFNDLEEDDFDAPAPKLDTKSTFFRQQHDHHKAVNLFDDEPPEFEAPPHDNSRQSGPSGLYFESENEDEFFDVLSQPRKQVQNTSKPSRTAPNLFNEEPPLDTFTAPSGQEDKKIEKKTPVNLFSDNDDASFPQASIAAKKNDQTVVEKKPPTTDITKLISSNLFDDDDEPEDFLETLLKGARAKTKPQDTIKTDKPHDVVREEVPKDTKDQKVAVKPQLKSKGSLFGDSDDEDIFSGSSKSGLFGKKEVKSVDPPGKVQKSDYLLEKEKNDYLKESEKTPKAAALTAKEDVEEKIEVPPEKDEEIQHQEVPEDDPIGSQIFEKPQSISSDSLFEEKLEEKPEEKDFVEPTKRTLAIPPPDLPIIPPEVDVPPSLKPTNVQLFDDLPPDDDLFFDRKVVSEIFYDDFADSFPPNAISVNSTGSSYIFNEEPPVDDWQEERRKTGSKSEIDQTIVKKSKEKEENVSKERKEHNLGDVSSKKSLENTNFLRSDSRDSKDEPDEIFSSVKNIINTHERIEKAPEKTLNKPKIKPNKLNKTMEINVAALLPGAKMPSFKNVPETSANAAKRPSVSESIEDDIEEQVEKALTKINDKSIKITEESGSHLTHPNKNRVRISHKRRPSTRKGRHETYRKSLIIDDEETKDENTASNEKVSEDQTLGETSGSLHEEFDIKKNEPKIDKKLSVKKTKDFARKTDEISSSQDDFFKTSEVLTEDKKSVRIKESSSASKSLFESDDESEGDIFSSKKPSVIPKSTSEPTKIKPESTSLFGDSDIDDDDLFGSLSKFNKSERVKTTVPITKVEKKIEKKSAVGDDPLADLL